MRLAARILDENPKIGMVYAYGRIVGDFEGPWLYPCSQEDLIFNEGAPAPSMYRKEIWRQVGGYHDYMYHGREDWDFSLSVIERGWQVYALDSTVGVYYRLKSESRSARAAKHEIALLANIYEKHKALFLRYPEYVAKMFYRCYARRLYYQSEEFKTGYCIVLPIAKIRDFMHYIMRWIKNKWMGRKMV